MPESTSYSDFLGVANERLCQVQGMRDDRFDELLTHNDLPHDMEIIQYRELANDATQLTSDLDDKIAELEGILDKLSELRDEAAYEGSLVKQVIHPIKTLSDEVLAEIFLNCVPSDPLHEDALDSLDTKIPPWTITQVSRKWRHISVHLPRLWSHIGLSFRFYERMPVRRQIFLLGTYITRSNQCDLSINLAGGYTHDSSKSASIFGLLELALPRCKILTAQLTSASLQSLAGNPLPRLQSIAIHPPPLGVPFPDPRVDVFQHLPTLRRCTFMGAFPTVQLPWTQITRMELVLEMGSLALLRKLVGLEELHVHLDHGIPPYTIGNSNGSADSNSNSPLVVMPQVKALYVNADKPGAAGDALVNLFKHISCPGLAHMSLYTSIEHPLALPSNSIFTAGSGAASPYHWHSLTKLELALEMDSTPSDTRVLLAFLRGVPSVETFVLWAGSWTLEFVLGMTVPPRVDVDTDNNNSIGNASTPTHTTNPTHTATILLPRLRHWDFHQSDLSTADVPAALVLAMLESRARATYTGEGALRSARLEEVRVYNGWVEENLGGREGEGEGEGNKDGEGDLPHKVEGEGEGDLDNRENLGNEKGEVNAGKKGGAGRSVRARWDALGERMKVYYLEPPPLDGPDAGQEGEEDGDEDL